MCTHPCFKHQNWWRHAVLYTHQLLTYKSWQEETPRLCSTLFCQIKKNFIVNRPTLPVNWPTNIVHVGREGCSVDKKDSKEPMLVGQLTKKSGQLRMKGDLLTIWVDKLIGNVCQLTKKVAKLTKLHNIKPWGFFLPMSLCQQIDKNIKLQLSITFGVFSMSLEHITYLQSFWCRPY